MGSLHGQKVVKKAFLPPSVEYIQVDSQFCYRVTLSTSKSNEVEVSALMEGEYAKDLVVTLEERGETILIAATFQPNFTAPNDKLSAHKVVSIALDVSVPQYKNVSVYGTVSNVKASGDFKNLNVSLSNGRCVLKDIGESVTVQTQKGDIFLETANGNINAKSTYGRVVRDDIPKGDNRYILNTIEGTIQLKKTK
ncbi:hypothetical protein [Flagellimonas flava]|nr:hypothetical protein [Allomuricauda flava]